MVKVNVPSKVDEQAKPIYEIGKEIKMKVSELISQLSNQDRNAEVRIWEKGSHSYYNQACTGVDEGISTEQLDGWSDKEEPDENHVVYIEMGGRQEKGRPNNA